MAKTKIPGRKRKVNGSHYAAAGLHEKAVRCRPPHLKSVKDRNGHRDWIAVSGGEK